MCTSVAPASFNNRTIFDDVVPRTMESSTTTTRLPLSTDFTGDNCSVNVYGSAGEVEGEEKRAFGEDNWAEMLDRQSSQVSRNTVAGTSLAGTNFRGVVLVRRNERVPAHVMI
jgi:hypothetical protein